MSAKYENKRDNPSARIWAGKYKNLHNLPHWHLEQELVACQSGSAKLMIDGHIFPIHGGEAALCPSGSVHYIESDQGGVTLVAKLDTTLVKGISGQYQLCHPVFTDRYGAADCIEEVFIELKEAKAFYQEKVEAMVVDLFVNIFRNEAAEPSTANSATMHRYKELLGEINEKFEFITFQEAAVYMNMNEAYFSRFFKKISGMTFSSYLNLIKIDKAVELLHLEPNIPVSSLMLECGFNTLRNFQRVFKAFTGYTPRQLPASFSLNIRTISNDQNGFDPTLPSSILL